MLTSVTDKDAGRQPDPSGDIQRHWQCDSNNLASGGVYVVMEGIVECGGRSWYELGIVTDANKNKKLTIGTGPAHAVYFATYEVVKQAMGGNASGHHPVAAGMPPSYL
jgi:hypothetical protein